MDLETILNELSVYNQNGPLPEEALREAVRQKETVAPALLEIMDQLYEYLSTHPDDDWPEDRLGTINMYGYYLLAELRDTRAFPRLLAFLSLDSEQVEYVFGGALTENVKNMLYSTYDGNPGPAMALAADRSKDPFARAAVVDCLGAVCLDGRLPREQFTAWIRGLLPASDAAHPVGYGFFSDDSNFLDCLTDSVEHAHLYELIPDFRNIFDRGMISSFSGDFAGFLDGLFNYRRPCASLMKPAAEVLPGWSEVKKPDSSSNDFFAVLSYNVGRNDPCPCGSGKKFKKCCLPKKQDLERSLQKENSVIGSRLDRYPPLYRAGTRPGLTDFFPKDAIEVDQPAWRGMKLSHTGMIPMKGDQERAELARDSFWTAFRKYQAICAEKGFRTPEEFDREYRVHYKSRQWLERMAEVLQKTEDRRLQEIQAVLRA